MYFERVRVIRFELQDDDGHAHASRAVWINRRPEGAVLDVARTLPHDRHPPRSRKIKRTIFETLTHRNSA